MSQEGKVLAVFDMFINQIDGDETGGQKCWKGYKQMYEFFSARL